MKLKIRYVILWTLCVFLTLGAPIKLVVKGLSTLTQSSSVSVEQVSPVTITGIKGSVFSFSHRRSFVAGSQSQHLQGYVKIRGKKYPAGASKVGNTLTVTYPTRIVNRRQRMNTLRISANSSGRLKSLPMSLSHRTSCASKDEEHVHSKTVLPLNEGLPPKTALFATLHTYADQEFYVKYGSATNERILSIVNFAEAIYGEQLGVRFNVVGQTIFSNNDSAYAPGEILSNFKNDSTTQNNDVDLKHLFTGKDMSGNTIGIAFVGAVCYAPTYAYGVTQDYYDYAPIIFAHEVGHNFGASHSTEYNTIMYPSISPWATQFSGDSLELINSHLNSFGSCLSVEPYGPDLSKSSITIKRMSRMIYGRLLDSSKNPIVNENVVVSINGKKVEYVTNNAGMYKHFLKPRKSKRRYRVFASTKNAEKVSRVLSFSF